MTAARLSKERLEALRHASQNYRDVLTEMLDTYESLAAEADRLETALGAAHALCQVLYPPPSGNILRNSWRERSAAYLDARRALAADTKEAK